MSGGSHKHGIKKFFSKIPKLFGSSSHGHDQPEQPRVGKSRMLGFVDYYGNVRPTERPERPPEPPAYNSAPSQPVNTAPPMAELPTFGIDPFAIPEGGNRRSGHQTFNKPAPFVPRAASGMTFGKAHRYAAAIPEWTRVHNEENAAAISRLRPDVQLGSNSRARSAVLMQTGGSYKDKAQNESIHMLTAAAERQGSQGQMSREDYTDLRTLVKPYLDRVMGIDLEAMLQMDDATLMENLPELDELRRTSMYVGDLMGMAKTPKGMVNISQLAKSSGTVGKALGGGGSAGAPQALKGNLREELLPTPEMRDEFSFKSTIMSNLADKARGLLLSELQRQTEEVAPGSGPNLNPMYFLPGELRGSNPADQNTNGLIDRLLETTNRNNGEILRKMRSPGSHYNIASNRR